MDNLWKRGATLVAYFDLVTSIISLILVGALGIEVLVGTAAVENFTTVLKSPTLSLVLAISSICCVILIWASAQLLQSVEERDRGAALRKAKYWTSVHMVTIVFGIFDAAINPQVSTVLAVLLRGVFMIIVLNFIDTLRTEKPTTEENADSTGIGKEALYELHVI